VRTGLEGKIQRTLVGLAGATYQKVRSCASVEPMLTSSLRAVCPPAGGCWDVTKPAPAILDRLRPDTMPCDGDQLNRVAEAAAGGRWTAKEGSAMTKVTFDISRGPKKHL